MGPINNLTSNYSQLILDPLYQNPGGASDATSKTGNDPSGIVTRSDTSQLSSFAQSVGTLQQLQESDPPKYQQVTQQIATNLQSAAQAAPSSGNSTAASQLKQLVTDFLTASKTGQLPNFQDLAQAVAGHHHHHHHAAPAASDSSSTDSTSGGGGANQTVNQLLSPPSEALNPLAIIQKTLSSAGFPGSNS